MGTSGYPWRAILPAWAGIAVAAGAAVVIEWLLLDEGLALAVAGTALIALVAAVVVTRRLMARNQQPLITVKDLRRR